MEAIEGIEEDTLIDTISSWALEEGLWDERPVSWEEQSELQHKIQERLLSILKTEEVNAAHREHLSQRLARLGSQFQHRHVQHLRLSDLTMAFGIGRSCKRFYSDHKKEIIVTVVVIAVVTTVVVIAVYSGGTAASGAGAAGTKLLNNLPGQNDAPPQIAKNPPSTEEVLERVHEELAENDIHLSSEETQKIADWYEKTYEKEQALAQTKLLPISKPIQKWGEYEVSRPFQIAGVSSNSMEICWMNGVNNTPEESQNTAFYLHELSGGREISGIYNHSNGVAIDLIEAVFVNHNGASPITAELLIDKWTAFHEKNIDKPNAKLQQFCHSQAAIHVKNALLQCPKEIRDRIIVEAIAPAAIIDKQLCFQAHNYVSEKDWIPACDPALVPTAPTSDASEEMFTEQAQKLRNSIIVLPVHPDSKDPKDHYAQSPTYTPPIKDALDNYNDHQGQYSPDERGK